MAETSVWMHLEILYGYLKAGTPECFKSRL